MLNFLEKIFFYLLIFCLPFQTRKIIYQWGVGFNEWTSAYLYLTDLLIVAIFFLWIWRSRKQRFFKKPFQISQQVKNPGFWLVIFLIVSLISLIQAKNIQLGFYAWIKLLEMAGLFFYLRYNFRSLFSLRRVAQVLVTSAFFQSLIAISQFVNQKSLGLWFLRESPLSSEIAGVAEIVVDNFKMIRAYGTLPHPNVLAVFLLISIFFWYFLWLSRKHSSIGNLFQLIIYGVLLIALLFTFSRLIISVFLLASLIYFIFIFWRSLRAFNKELFKRISALFFLFVVYSSLLTIMAWPEISSRWQISLTEQAVSLRAFYNQTALLIIREHPWLGIGLGNFVWEIRQLLDLLNGWLHQPVHNLYLLIASETGLIGLILFLLFVFRVILPEKSRLRRPSLRYCFLLIVSSLLFIGLSDHFFWTLQQGQLIFWLILGILASQIRIKRAP